MRSNVQARLDPESQVALERLVRRFGWSRSRVVREGLRLLDARYSKAPKRRVIGLGQFDSGFTDLGTNKKYMEGFGR